MRSKVLHLRVLGLFIVATGLLSGCKGKEAPKPAGPPTAAAAAPTPLTGAIPVFSADLASGKKWTASSQVEIWATSGKIPEGTRNQVLFHTKEEESPWFMVDLETPTSVSSVDVLNRQDCCGERAVPLLVELSNDARTWREVARRDEPFTEWKATFSAQDARYVRLRVPRKTYLHLQAIGIHGPGGEAGGTARPRPKS